MACIALALDRVVMEATKSCNQAPSLVARVDTVGARGYPGKVACTVETQLLPMRVFEPVTVRRAFVLALIGCGRQSMPDQASRSGCRSDAASRAAGAHSSALDLLNVRVHLAELRAFATDSLGFTPNGGQFGV